ncbi:MAG TPA: hypothetical protein PKA28_04865 [Methylomusa anaerophila]|nr:hypothetical protein [Methylomusa anaerophila]HML87761.1 hypothetical protein [Methylomusa anaerophila]
MGRTCVPLVPTSPFSCASLYGKTGSTGAAVIGSFAGLRARTSSKEQD